jgi:CAAX prenyl protease-like protein
MPATARNATLGYVAPFVAFVAVMAIEHTFLPGSQQLYPLRFLVTLAAIIYFSRPYLNWKFSAPVASIALGIAVCAIWVAPDRLFHYRDFWLFSNAITGKASSSIAPDLKTATWFLAIRILGSVALVPIAEELFWRGFLMRWLIDTDFEKIPLGKYAPGAFWIVALLFASEHGPYWEVGLIAGVIYNWWLLRTRSLADCILAHAVTNAALAGWVLFTGEWQYWM